MMINIPAQPGQGPDGLPTPGLPGDTPASPGEGPEGLPTPSLPGPGPVIVPTPLCPTGYTPGVVRRGQSYTDLLLQYDVSYQAMRAANPALSPTRPAVGARYCAPPARSRRLCPSGSQSYVLSQDEDLETLSLRLGVAPGELLLSNTALAPSDFVPGRVVCIP